MHVGLSVLFQNLGRELSDAEVYRAEVALADQAEPRGFDSIWAAEHHFCDYMMSPNPLQFLTYMAGRTSRARLGTMVVVLPWHDPIRVAEQAATLDVLSGGRVVLGFGRGLGPIEFDGFRLEMGESRQRFVEYAETVMGGLETGVMEHDGELFRQPRVDLRPQPTISFRGRTYASAVSPESAKIMARLGFGLLIIAQKPWPKIIREVEDYRALFEAENGEAPPRPLLVNFTSIDRSSERALELQQVHGLAYSESAVNHYEFTNPRLSEISGYEYYAALREVIMKTGPQAFAQTLTDLQIYGTPAEVAEQTIERVRLLDGAGVINVFGFGGLAADDVQSAFDLYVDEVLPVLKQADTFRDIEVASTAAPA